jgi:hypothetical protein
VVEFQGTTMDINLKWSVKGNEKFKTKAGEREGLLVTATGSGEIDKKKVKMDWQVWFVKGQGALKTIVSTTSNGAKDTVTFQETK